MKVFDNQGRLKAEINTTFVAGGKVIVTNTLYGSNGQPVAQNVSIRESSGKVKTENTFGGKLRP